MNSESKWKLSIVLRLVEVLVLSGTLIAISISTCEMKKSVQQQSKSIQQQYLFDQTSLNPWIDCSPDSKILLKDGSLKLKLEYSNAGKTPAFKFQPMTILYHGSHRKFKDECFIFTDIVIKGPDVEGIIFPNETMSTSTAKNRIKGYSKEINKENILEMIVNRDFYLFVHVKYTDFNANENFWHFLFQPKLLKEIDQGFKCQWGTLSVSTNDTLKNPKKLSDTCAKKTTGADTKKQKHSSSSTVIILIFIFYTLFWIFI